MLMNSFLPIATGSGTLFVLHAFDKDKTVLALLQKLYVLHVFDNDKSILLKNLARLGVVRFIVSCCHFLNVDLDDIFFRKTKIKPISKQMNLQHYIVIFFPFEKMGTTCTN